MSYIVKKTGERIRLCVLFILSIPIFISLKEYALNNNININILALIGFGIITFLILSLIRNLTAVLSLDSDTASVLAYFSYPLMWIKNGDLNIITINPYNPKEHILIPKITLPQNEEEFKKTDSSLSSSFNLPVIAGMAMLVFGIFLYNYTKFNIINPTSKFYIYFTLIIYFICCINNLFIVSQKPNDIMGERLDKNSLKNKSNIKAAEMLYYASLSNDFETQKTDFIIGKISSFLKRHAEQNNISSFDIKTFDFILYKYLCGKIKKLNDDIIFYMNFLLTHLDEYYANKANPFKQQLIIYSHIILYMIRNGKEEKAREILKKIEDKEKNTDNRVVKYVLMRSHHMLKDENNYAFLSDPSNFIYPNFGFINFLLCDLTEEEKTINRG